MSEDATKPLLVEFSTPQVQASTTKQQHSNMHCRRRKSLVIIICALLITIMTVCVYVLRSVPEFYQYHLVRAYAVEPNEGQTTRSTRTILLWNDFFGNKRWGLPDDTLGPSYFRDDMHCPVYQCELTNERDLLPALDMFDAVVFHTAQTFSLYNSVPSRRSERQLYVFALMEPPGETKHVLRDENNFYNLTMTYRLDSDIAWPYKNMIDIEHDMLVSPAKYPKWRQVPSEWNDTVITQLWANKSKMAAWFVSHCETLSRRERLAEELQKYIDVDIYGKCGTLSCPISSAKQCDEMLDQKYKFYFSFENSLCTDYVTEKLYNALNRNIIPVVFGGANYERFLPPHSYINAEDFATVEALAQHLQYVAANVDEYVRYFWWRSYYRMGYHSPFCDLCEKLHSVSYQERRQTYQNIEKWWLADSCRLEAKIKF